MERAVSRRDRRLGGAHLTQRGTFLKAERGLIGLRTRAETPPPTGQATVEDVAVAYARRWEHENGNDELKTHLHGPAGVLRSRLPEPAHREIWALLIVHHGINTVIAASPAAADPPPDQIS